MAPPERRIPLPKLAVEAPGENDQVLPATSKRRVLPPCRRNAPVARQNTPSGFNHRQEDNDQIARLQATVEHLRQRISSKSTPKFDQPGTSLSLSPPVVENIRRDVQFSEDLVELLRDQPEAFALQVLESLRQGRSPKEIMDSLGGNLSTNINPSILAAARGSVTPTQTTLEFQLVVQYSQCIERGGEQSSSTAGIVRQNILWGRQQYFFIDPRLHHVGISRWTIVPISNQFAAEAIALYLNMNQSWWAYFDTDLFLDTLVNVETNFCSRMLVNALLTWATLASQQSYAHYEPRAATLPTKFLDEALRIYDDEKGVDCPTTVAATSLMGMKLTTLGSDKAGSRLQENNATMAQRMSLYGESDVYSQNRLNLSDESSAVAIFKRLLGWADELPAGVQRHENNPDHVLNLHIWFHTAIIDLFRPFEHEFPQPKHPAFAGVNATPKAVISASIEQLKRLVYQYRANCESSKYSIIWQSGMLYLVNHILRDLSSSGSQFYFLLCMRGYQHLARHMPFVSGIVQSLIVMTKRQGVPLTADTQRLLEEARDESRRSREFFSAYPGDLEMVAKDPTSATLEKLTSLFQEGPSGAGQGEASDSGSLPDGWKGTAQDLTTTLSMLEDN
ncbi:C6 zinc finger domain-containing protein [Fusarium denticulatum]|uniref:C6 zinc finger domain-containing protein n=1 Tax=Fusarium denticulatum TaxID=48507 RepID=A0A8H5T276_9HYPO|nr:C6 zinc finger domain-containing protein [Fusarium denticulatum]